MTSLKGADHGGDEDENVHSGRDVDKAPGFQLTLVYDARVELDGHRVSDDLAEESGWVPALVLWRSVLHAG